MPTLKQLMGNKTRGDGRKFTRAEWPSFNYFEPIFLVRSDWVGINEADEDHYFCEDQYSNWHEWTPPKQTKKVKLYRPIYKTETNEYVVDGWWRSYKAENSARGKAVGWQEIEVEVTE